MNIKTAVRSASRRRSIVGFVLRLAALAASFAVLKISAPALESAASNLIRTAPTDVLFIAGAGLAADDGESTEVRIFTSQLPLALSPAPDEPEAPTDGAAKADTPSDTAPQTVLPSLFYVPDTLPDETETLPPALETTITGEKSSVYRYDEGIYFKNNTEYAIDVGTVLSQPFPLGDGTAKVLIIHTHGSESYMREAGQNYTESDPYRTTDNAYNVTRVGNELARVLEDRGISVIHDTALYDYPTYSGSYTRSDEAINAYLAQNPDISVVIDLHRDALEASDGTVYKTVAEVNGETCAQVMLIVGSDWSGLKHPDWRENLKLGMRLQKTMSERYPTLARPLKVSEYRYNQDATHGSLIAEIGCCGNTLSEAIAAVRYFGDCLASVLGK